jgi:hypothetical protein
LVVFLCWVLLLGFVLKLIVSGEGKPMLERMRAIKKWWAFSFDILVTLVSVRRRTTGELPFSVQFVLGCFFVLGFALLAG